MVEYNVPDAMNVLLQDLYTPKGYNPAEYTLLGYDPNMYGNVDPMYSYYNPAEMGMSQPAQAMPAQAMPAEGAMSNADIEALAQRNAEVQGKLPTPWTPDKGIMAMPEEQKVGFAGYDAEGLAYDNKGRAYDVLGRMVKDEYGRGAVGLTAQQAGITPEMAARGMTLADVWGP